MEQAVHGGPADRDGRKKDHRPLGTAREVLGFGVAVRVPLVGGREASMSMASARMAATRLTSDSSASERSPTAPVRVKAIVFIAMVTTAAAMESHA